MNFSKRAQVSIYIIIAIVLVVGIVVYFGVKQGLGGEEIPFEMVPVFDYYQSCVEQETATAVKLAGMQGGRVAIGDYIPGSEHAPFSNHLNFLGSPIKYWYYVSGNGLIKEEVPSKQEMEREIADYVAEGLKHCDFEYFYRQGFSVELGEAEVDVEVFDRKVIVDVNSDMTVSKEGDVGRKTEHNAEVTSKLGKFYDLAREIYNEEMNEALLEKYAADVLYHYAPVDGVEIQCGPEIWLTSDVISELKEGLEENFRTIKFKGSYYELSGDDREYFVWDKGVDEAVNVMYAKDWPTKVEIFGEGVDDEIMIAEAMGTQEGMGAMGFCYVPYHFVYDVSFPALIQIFDTEELFQFPVVVVIDKNMPRNALVSEMPFEEPDFDLCEVKTEEIVVNIYDANLNEVDANVSYECFKQRCRLGESKNGALSTLAPACVNGYLHLRADGYADKKQLFSTNRERFADVILEREHEVEVELKVGGSDLDGTAIVSFARDDGVVKTVALPEIETVKLSEGSYEIKVYVYGDSGIVIPASSKTECVDVPRGGILSGLFGATKEECFDINVPETKIEYALIGGGSLNTYLLETELEKGHAVLGVDKFAKPNSLEDLSKNFELFETKKLWVEFDEI
ncbi:MAG: hypothetical protein KJ600_05155 [Nanoarchaeota archaeon]|nr:hypothetical protein [Nanoarchaeota archaeon]MBU1103918.1 hypothetical protein [Nanoarchaeota archaeon]